MKAKEMRAVTQNQVRTSRQKRMRRVKEIDYHAAYLPEMTFKERRTFRKNKMRMSKQKKLKIIEENVKAKEDETRMPMQRKMKREENAKAEEEDEMRMPVQKKMRREENAKPDEEEDEKRMPKQEIMRRVAYLPGELVENILTRLPIPTLAQHCSCVSKLWYNSIFGARFAMTHYLHNKKHKLSLGFILLNVLFCRGGASFFSLDNNYKFKLSLNLDYRNKSELVGYCNGIACLTELRKDAYGPNWMIVVNPIRRETLSLTYNYPNDGECEYLCHGFGFDSSTNEYKVVIIFTSKDNEEELISMAFTLGTNSWRTSVAQISAPPGCTPFASRLVTRVATLCAGDLFWRMTNNHTDVRGDNKIGMLLSFDIHKEKIQSIQLPAGCSLSPTPAMMDVVVEHHLLEHKGYPCFAQSEKAITNILHRSCRCSNEQSSVCCCCCRYMIQLYVLKDKEKQVWIKGETFGVQVRELGLPPAPFCCYFDTLTRTTASFPTRIMSVSDQVLLYWFDGKCLKLYNLQTKHLKVVGSSSSSDRPSRIIFEFKMKTSPPLEGLGVDCKNLYSPYLDYHLQAQPENILSLRTFIHAGETRWGDTFMPTLIGKLNGKHPFSEHPGDTSGYNKYKANNGAILSCLL